MLKPGAIGSRMLYTKEGIYERKKHIHEITKAEGPTYFI